MNKPYAKMHYYGSSPDPADAYWGIACRAATLDFEIRDKDKAQQVVAALNAAYTHGQLDFLQAKRKKS